MAKNRRVVSSTQHVNWRVENLASMEPDIKYAALRTLSRPFPSYELLFGALLAKIGRL